MICRRNEKPRRSRGFTRPDLIAILSIICLLGLVATRLLARMHVIAAGASCLDNLRELTLAWSLYAEDDNGKVVNNLAAAEMQATYNAHTYLNWEHNWLDWTTSPSNTNRAMLTTSKLFPYLQNGLAAFKCPADIFLSAAQAKAGWTRRLRSYSMNGFMGPLSLDKNNSSYKGENSYNPGYRQFLLTSSIPRPSRTIVFLDEHPDSINDGFFIEIFGNPQWADLPGSHHNGAGGFAFADGHGEMHTWLYSATKQPVRYNFPVLPPISPSQRVDYLWLTERMSVKHSTLGISRPAAGQAQVIWSYLPSTYKLQSTPNLETPTWTNVPETPVQNSGQISVTTQSPDSTAFFRLFRP